MKFILATLALSFLTTQAHGVASGLNFACVEESRSALTASVNLNEKSLRIQFGQGFRGELEKDLKGQRTTLAYDAAASRSGYASYTTQFKVGPNAGRDARTLSVRFQESGVDGEVRMTFAISDVHEKGNDAPTSFTDYPMVCDIL